MANRSATTYVQSFTESTFLVSFTATQCVTGLVANAVVICYLLWRKKLSFSPSEKVNLNLALADFVALSTYVPWRAYILYLRRPTKNSPYYTSLFVACIFCTGNAVLLVAVARFIFVFFPLKYKKIFSGRVANRVIVASWVTAVTLGVGHRISLKDMMNCHREYELFLSVLSFFQPVAILTVYGIILRTTKLTQHDFTPRSISWTVYTIVFLSYATFLPYTVYRIVSTADKCLTTNQKRATWRWIMAFSFLNSCCNPFLYIITTKRLRQLLMFSHTSETNASRDAQLA